MQCMLILKSTWRRDTIILIMLTANVNGRGVIEIILLCFDKLHNNGPPSRKQVSMFRMNGVNYQESVPSVECFTVDQVFYAYLDVREFFLFWDFS